MPTSMTPSAKTILTTKAKELRELFQTPKNFMEFFKPARQYQVSDKPEIIHSDKTPTLGTVAQAFKSGTAISWIAIQVRNLSEYSGCKEKLSIYQIDELSRQIFAQYGYMRIAEFMDFFRRFKGGEYGRFYGAVDPLVIACGLREYAKTRMENLTILENERKKQEQISNPEYIAYKRKYWTDYFEQTYKTHKRRQPTMTRQEFECMWIENHKTQTD